MRLNGSTLGHCQERSSRIPPESKSTSKLAILKSDLGIEMAYYFLMLITFALFFSSDYLLLTLLAVFGMIHLVDFQSPQNKKSDS